MKCKNTIAMVLAGAMLLPSNAFAADLSQYRDFPNDWSAKSLEPVSYTHLGHKGAEQPVVTLVLGTFPRGVGMRKVDCTAPVLDLSERRELLAVVHGNGLEYL